MKAENILLAECFDDYTLGCGISTFSAWQELTKEWNAVLVDAGIGMFHMADFEARAKPFDAWSEEKRRRVLNGLLDIVSRHILRFAAIAIARQI